MIRLEEVPRAGLRVETTLEVEWAAVSLAPAYEVSGKMPAVRFDASRDGVNLNLVGELEVELKFQCSRCAEPGELCLLLPVQALFVPRGAASIRLEDAEFDNESPTEMFGYEADTFSVEQPFREQLVVNVEPFPICGPGCKGLCSGCGVNLNSQQCSCTIGKVDPRWASLAGLKVALAEKERAGSGGQDGRTEEEEVES